MPEHPNCQAIEAFLETFKVERPIVQTQRIDGQPAKNAYTASFHDPVSGYGFTAIAWGEGHFKAFAEFGGNITQAANVGKRLAPVIEPEN